MVKIDDVSMRNKFGELVLEFSKEDERVCVLDGDLGNSTKSDAVEKGNSAKFLQMGIAEQNMVGVSAGLAEVGMQPWVSTFAAFLSKRSLDQVQVSVAQTESDVKLVGAYSGILNGKAGKTHQALEDIAIMRSLSNMIVLAPADVTELESIMRFSNKYTGPVYMRLARDNVQSVFDSNSFEEFKLGKASKLREGVDVTIISTGTQTARALNAANTLKEDGYSVAVIHMSSIKPIDESAIIEAAKKTGAIVTTEDHNVMGGLGSAVAEVISENYPVPMIRNGVDDVNSQSGPDDEILEFYGLNEKHISEAVRRAIKLKLKIKNR